MRITGGQLKGRRVKSPGSGLRPTQELVREALFSMLGETVRDARFLDLYAGSGAVGIEAWSRGAAHVCWVEKHRATCVQLKQAVHALCGREGQVLQADALSLPRAALTGGPYDIIFADPPYEKPGVESEAGLLLDRIRRAAEASGWIRPGGLLIFEQRSQTAVHPCRAWVPVRDRQYGRTRLLVFRYEPEAGDGDEA